MKKAYISINTNQLVLMDDGRQFLYRFQELQMSQPIKRVMSNDLQDNDGIIDNASVYNIKLTTTGNVVHMLENVVVHSNLDKDNSYNYLIVNDFKK